MFAGKYEYKVDNKGRVPLPPKFRKGIEDGLILTMIADNCITAYPKEEWNKMTSGQYSNGFFMSDKQRKLNRFIFSNANEVSIDNQGRIALPSTLRESASITDSVIIAGINNYFEIWNPELWHKENLHAEEARHFMDMLEERR